MGPSRTFRDPARLERMGRWAWERLARGHREATGRTPPGYTHNGPPPWLASPAYRPLKRVHRLVGDGVAGRVLPRRVF